MGEKDHPFSRYPHLVQDLDVVRPDQLWVSDITYIKLRKEFVYLAVIMDMFTRYIRDSNLGRSLGLTLMARQRTLAQHPREIYQSD